MCKSDVEPIDVCKHLGIRTGVSAPFAAAALPPPAGRWSRLRSRGARALERERTPPPTAGGDWAGGRRRGRGRGACSAAAAAHRPPPPRRCGCCRKRSRSFPRRACWLKAAWPGTSSRRWRGRRLGGGGVWAAGAVCCPACGCPVLERHPRRAVFRRSPLCPPAARPPHAHTHSHSFAAAIARGERRRRAPRLLRSSFAVLLARTFPSTRQAAAAAHAPPSRRLSRRSRPRCTRRRRLPGVGAALRPAAAEGQSRCRRRRARARRRRPALSLLSQRRGLCARPSSRASALRAD